ncbi:hypothetical protein HDU96_003800 [Phlyctochytrium bullatum]|nr:hypothetical protein HDU96_003800 [Phlyctochytrium bullatum]
MTPLTPPPSTETSPARDPSSKLPTWTAARIVHLLYLVRQHLPSLPFHPATSTPLPWDKIAATISSTYSISVTPFQARIHFLKTRVAWFDGNWGSREDMNSSLNWKMMKQVFEGGEGEGGNVNPGLEGPKQDGRGSGATVIEGSSDNRARALEERHGKPESRAEGVVSATDDDDTVPLRILSSLPAAAKRIPTAPTPSGKTKAPASLWTDAMLVDLLRFKVEGWDDKEAWEEWRTRLVAKFGVEVSVKRAKTKVRRLGDEYKRNRGKGYGHEVREWLEMQFGEKGRRERRRKRREARARMESGTQLPHPPLDPERHQVLVEKSRDQAMLYIQTQSLEHRVIAVEDDDNMEIVLEESDVIPPQPSQPQILSDIDIASPPQSSPVHVAQKLRVPKPEPVPSRSVSSPSFQTGDQNPVQELHEPSSFAEQQAPQNPTPAASPPLAAFLEPQQPSAYVDTSAPATQYEAHASAVSAVTALLEALVAGQRESLQILQRLEQKSNVADPNPAGTETAMNFLIQHLKSYEEKLMQSIDFRLRQYAIEAAVQQARDMRAMTALRDQVTRAVHDQTQLLWGYAVGGGVGRVGAMQSAPGEKPMKQ